MARMNNSNPAVKTAQKWADKIGHGQAVARLVTKGVSVSTAEKLCTGRYGANPRTKLAKVLFKEMRKDGFALECEVAS